MSLNTYIGLRLEKDMVDAIDAIAAQQRTKPSNILRGFLRRARDAYEDEQWLQLALEREKQQIGECTTLPQLANLNYSFVVTDAVISEDLPAIPAEMQNKIIAHIKTFLTVKPLSFGRNLSTMYPEYGLVIVKDYCMPIKVVDKTITILAIVTEKKIYES